MTEHDLRQMLRDVADLAPRSLEPAEPALLRDRARPSRSPTPAIIAAVAAVTIVAVVGAAVTSTVSRRHASVAPADPGVGARFVGVEITRSSAVQPTMGVFDLATGERLRDVRLPPGSAGRFHELQNGQFGSAEPGPGRCESTYTLTSETSDPASPVAPTGTIPYADVFNIAISPNGKYTAFSGKVCGQSGSIVGIFASGHAEQMLGTSRWPTFTFSLSFSRDERRLLFATGNGPHTGALHTMQTQDATTSDIVDPAQDCFFVDGRFADNGDVLASETCSHDSYLVRTDSVGRHLLFSVPGDAVITATSDGRAALIHWLRTGGDRLASWTAAQSTDKTTDLPGRYSSAELSWQR
jgi:hypothetical protein